MQLAALRSATAAHDGTEEPASPRFSLRLVASVEYLLLLLGFISLAFTDHRITSDGLVRFETLGQLLAGEGLSEARYSLIGPVFAAPLWLLSLVVSQPEIILSYYNLVTFAIGLLALFLLLHNRIDPTLLRRFLLLLVAGTMIPAHITDFYGETFSTVTVGVGIFATYLAVTHPWLRTFGWAGIIIGTANVAATLPALGLMAADRALGLRRLRYVLPIVAAAGLILGEAWLRRGSPFDQGYHDERFDFPMVLGILAILFSFGKGLIFFTPGIFLPVKQKFCGLFNPEKIDLWGAYRSLLVYVAGMVLVYANWWAWSGDLYWGPRFFLLAILPASLALALWLARPERRPLPNLILLGVLGMSVWVAANSTLFEQMGSPRCYGTGDYRQEDHCRFGTLDSDLWYPLSAWPDLAPRHYLQLSFFSLVFIWLALPAFARLLCYLSAQLRDRPGLKLTSWRW